METTDPQVKKYLKSLAHANRLDQVMLRGCIQGVFTALGTTIGFAILIVVAAQLISGLKQVPLLDTILAQTGLDVLIEQQRTRLQSGSNSSNSSANPDTQALTFQHQDSGLKFNYPSSLATLTENRSSGERGSVVAFTGNGLLSTLDVYINKPVVVIGNKFQVFANRGNGQRITVDVYEAGANVGNVQISNAVFVTQIKVSGDEYNFVGIGSKDTPKQARDLFVEIIQTVEVN